MHALTSLEEPRRFITNNAPAEVCIAALQILVDKPGDPKATMLACGGAIGTLCIAFASATGAAKHVSEATDVEVIVLSAFFTAAPFLTEGTARALWGSCFEPLLERVPALPSIVESMESRTKLLKEAVAGVPELEALFNQNQPRQY